MSYRNKAITSVIQLALVYLLLLLSLGVASAQAGLTINQLVTSEQTVTLQAPSGDYYYQWTADNWRRYHWPGGGAEFFI